MTLLVIYISLHLLTIILIFSKKNWSEKYKKTLISTHLVLLSFILLDVFFINIIGAWFERLIVVVLLLTASKTFALYARKLKVWQKLYFGFYLFYPIIATATLLIDRIMFFVVASPLLIILTIPDTKFSSKEYDLRENLAIMAPTQFNLIKKGLITEKYLGVSSDELIKSNDISGLTILKVIGDTTIVLVNSGNKSYRIPFYKLPVSKSGNTVKLPLTTLLPSPTYPIISHQFKEATTYSYYYGTLHVKAFTFAHTNNIYVNIFSK